MFDKLRERFCVVLWLEHKGCNVYKPYKNLGKIVVLAHAQLLRIASLRARATKHRKIRFRTIHKRPWTLQNPTQSDLKREKTDQHEQKTEIGDLTAAEYLLGCCATVDEAADALAALNVVPTPLIGKSAIGSIHLSVQDASGASRVLEYVDGALRVYDNTEVGVLTNDPSYEWQVGNLNQYAAYPTSHSEARFALKVKSRGPFTSFAVAADGGETSTPVDPSHGTHTRFLPGGYTPPDRFVKMFLLKQTAVAHAPPHTRPASSAFHLV